MYLFLYVGVSTVYLFRTVFIPVVVYIFCIQLLREVIPVPVSDRHRLRVLKIGVRRA